MRFALAFILLLFGGGSAMAQTLRNQFTTNQAMNAVSDGWSSVWNATSKMWSNVLVAGAGGDASGTNSRQGGALILTNFSALTGKSNSVLIITANNTPTNAQRRFYFETNSSAILSNLIAEAVAGDEVELGSGHFFAELKHIKVPVGVRLRGQGKRSTFVHGKGGLTTNGPIIRISSSNEVSDISIICDNKNLFNQAGIGTLEAAGDNGLTNVVLHDIFVDGDSDGFYFSGSLPHFVTGWNLEAKTAWDALAINSSGNAFSNSVFKFMSCIFEANLSGTLNPSSISAATSRGAVIGAGHAIFIGCRLIGTNANDSYGAANAESGAGSITLVGSYVEGAGTNNSAPVISPSMPVIFGGVNFGIRELPAGSTVDYRPPLSYKATNILAGGLGSLAIESIVDLAEWRHEYLETTGFIKYQGFAMDSWGSGSPEGVLAANVGSNYRCTNCTGSSAWYLKTNGNGTTTGWWLVQAGSAGNSASGQVLQNQGGNVFGTNSLTYNTALSQLFLNQGTEPAIRIVDGVSRSNAVGAASINLYTNGVNTVSITSEGSGSSGGGSVLSRRYYLNPTNNNNVQLTVANSNAIPVTNIFGLVERGSATPAYIVCSLVNNVVITNRVTAATAITFLDTSVGQEYSVIVPGEIAGGTSRVITLTAGGVGGTNLIANMDVFGTALAFTMTFTLTNGNAAEINGRVSRVHISGAAPTNVVSFVSRQYAF